MALCPHCQHAVPEPLPAQCPNCGGDPHPSPAPLLPPASIEPPGPPGPGIAWDERGRIGFFTALVETTRQVLTDPVGFFRAMPVAGGLASPLLYAVVMGWLGLAVAAFYQALFHSVVGSSLGALGGRPELAAALGWVEGWAGFVGQVVFGGGFVVIGLFVFAGILHLMLLLLGGARRDFEATFRVVGFSQATSLVLLLPFCGQLIGIVWSLVLCVIGLAEAHRIGHGKAAAAVLLPLVVACCCCAGLLFLFAGAIAAALGQVS